MSWTDERIDQLTKMWESGATASQIAEDLGGVSRNAVIGKAHRLGLKARPSPVKANDRAEQVVKPAEPITRAADAASVETIVLPVAEPAGEPVDASPPEPLARPSSAVASSAVVSPAMASPAAGSAAPALSTTASPVEQPSAAANARVAASPVPVGGAGATSEPLPPPAPRIVSVGPGGFLRQGPGDQQAPIPPAPPRRLVPAKPSADISAKTSLLDLNDRICRWPMGHPGEADFHFCGVKVNPSFPYCVEHCGRAYQAQLPRGHRRPPPPLPFGGPRVR